MNKLQAQYNAFSRIAELVNQAKFNGELPKIAITLQGGGAGAGDSYGWFWAERWQSKDEKIHELNITAENIDNPLQLFVTMHHELIHLYAKVHEIQDTSRQGRWHNKEFQKLCAEFGLFYLKDKTIGTTTPHTKEEGVKDEYISWVSQALKDEIIDTWLSSGDVFKRVLPEKEKKPSKFLTYHCQECGEGVSLRRELVEASGVYYCPYCGAENPVESEED